MKALIVSVLIFIFIANSYAQTPGWHVLPNAPFDAGRFEDTYFVNASTGWIILYAGKVYKTTDGGTSWNISADLSSKVRGLRSTGYFDSNIGLIGTLDTSHTLYRTTDGGFTWTEISGNIQGPHTKGFCGISIVNDTTAYASGRYDNGAYVIKTTNKGLSWNSLNTGGLATRLIDCYFWSPDSGFVIGGLNANAVILLTVNGGINWNIVYQSTRNSEWCWKIQFVNKNLGFASIERESTPTFILKTTNSGFNWQEIPIPSNIYNLEGLGFLNESTGWVGGWGGNYQMPNYETTDAGLSWHSAGWGVNMNRIRFLSDTLAYAVGQTVYKYTSEPIGIQPISNEMPEQFSLSQNYPNPFNPETKIRFEIPSVETVPRTVRLIIYNSLGQEIKTLVNEPLNAGVYEVTWNASEYPSGVYFYSLAVGGNTNNGSFTQTRKLVLLK